MYILFDNLDRIARKIREKLKRTMKTYVTLQEMV